ncbi:MAG TPA: 1,2-phenylacetyl-CoA epoxidase subunit PaaC [Cryptosporangiaceae bacterium]|nr:1,2-phenylacetyl-CoA epoxidase subunit PaaC [Cryptosporangiaceae bacterium]
MTTDADLFTYTLRLGDDALVASHRLAEWTTRAPELEEDVALANLALDLLGQARTLLAYAGTVQARQPVRTEDDLAYLRDPSEFANCLLVELPIGDFAFTIARQLAFATYQLALYECLQDSADAMLAAVAGKAVKEVAYHRDHATQWTLRLGDGTEESHRRMQAGLVAVWPYVDELFTGDDVEARLAGVGVAVDLASLRPEWSAYVDGVLAEATLVRPPAGPPPGRGRNGHHTEHLVALLAEVQALHRAHPGATW